MGLAAEGPYLYMAGEMYYDCGYVEYCVSDSAETYLDFNGVTGDIFDIAYDSGDIWLACASGHPVRCFDVSGSVVDYLESSLIPSAWGLTMDDEGYLWVSDTVNDLIYRVDLGTALSRSTWGGIKILAE
jgi:hypothetical protein